MRSLFRMTYYNRERPPLMALIEFGERVSA